MNFAIAHPHRLTGKPAERGTVLPSEASGLKSSERRALRRAERAHGMSRETRERTNALVRTLDLPTGRRSA